MSRDDAALRLKAESRKPKAESTHRPIEFTLSGLQITERVVRRTSSERYGSAGLPTARLTADVVVRIDPDKLRHIALRALRSRSGRTTLADGGIVMTLVRDSIERTPIAERSS